MPRMQLDIDPFSEVPDAAAWNRAARRQRCELCKLRAAKQGHHVVYKQELRKRHWPLYDLRDQMALCDQCHGDHHSANGKIPLSALSDRALDFAFGLLGAHAFDYLHRRYSGDDPRLKQRLELAEAA